MSIINYASTIAGGGKTYSIIRAAIHRSTTGRNTVICVPTLILAEEIRRSLHEQHHTSKISLFHKDDGREGAVTTRVRAYLDTCEPDGQILIITHQCFECLPYFSRKGNWRVFFDENISVFETNTVNLPENHGIITNHMTISDAGSVYGLVTVMNSGRLRTVVENKNNDQAWALVHDIGSALLNENCDNYVKIRQFNDLVEGRKQEGQLTIYSLRRPDKFLGFEQVSFASALFEESLTYHYWKRLGVDWIDDSEILGSVIRIKHPENPNLHIYYGYDGKNSKALRNRLEKNGNNELREKSRDLMGDEPYLWLENKDWEETSILKEVGSMLPPGCAGLNTYSHIRHAIILPAYNYDPGQSDFLSKVAWFDKEMQGRAMNLNLYQAFLRTVIRNGDVGEETRWVVACRQDAELLSERFPGSVIKPLGLTPLPERKVGRPKVHNDNEDRRHRYEERRKEQLARSADFVDDLGPEFLRNVVFHDKSDKTTLKSIGNFVRNYRGSYFNNYFDKEPQNVTMNEKNFIKWLRQLSTKSFKSKDEIPCISGVLFDPRKSSKSKRHTENVALCRGMWIDIELGDMTVKQFERSFPHIQFVAFNTFRHTKQDPRYRIYIPTDRPMYFEESVAIYHEIRYSLKDQGWNNGKRDAKPSASFNRSFDGIDCRPNPSLLSILPCQTQSGKDSFFLDLTKGKEPLNVDAWLNQRSWFKGDDDFYELPPINYNNEKISLADEEQFLVSEATSRWESHGRLKGNGDTGIFTLYIVLRRAGLPYHELRWRLLHAATQSTSPTDRRRQVEELLRKFKH